MTDGQNHQTTVQATPAASQDQVWDSQPGTFFIDPCEESITYNCPCGCDQAIALPIKRGGDGKGWRWDGNLDRPTLDPSIRRMDGCRWHGWLKAGIWEPAGDSGK